MNWLGRLFVAVALVLSLGSVANAQSQERTEVLRFTDVVTELPIGDCGDFTILNDWVANWRIVRHFGADGQVSIENWHIRVVLDRLYNSTDPSKEVFGGPGEVQNSRLFVAENTLTLTGMMYRVTLPGSGVILLEAGTQVIDLGTGEVITHHGPGDITFGNVAALCDALK